VTTYYVRKTGDNGNAGTSPGAAWGTIDYALGSTSGFTNGDTLYIGAGVYREDVDLLYTNGTNPTYVIGDIRGQYTGDAGEVIITTHLTSWDVATSAATALDLQERDYVTFRNIHFIADSSGNPGLVKTATTTGGASTNITFEDCIFSATGDGDGLVYILVGTAAPGTALNWTIDRCLFDHTVISFLIAPPSSDYDDGTLIRNCVFRNSNLFTINFGGGTPSTGRIYGFRVVACTFCGGRINAIKQTSGAYRSSTPAITAEGCLIIDDQCGGSPLAAFYAATSGTISEDWNIVNWGWTTTHTNVTTGSNSSVRTKYAQQYVSHPAWPQFRHQLAPWDIPEESIAVGFIPSATSITDWPTVDFWGRPRPGSGTNDKTVGAAVAYQEATVDTGTKHASSSSLKLIGPMVHDVVVPVHERCRAIECWARYDSGTYTLGSKPRMTVMMGESVGISTVGVDMTAGSNTWQRLLVNIAPTGNGLIRVRLENISSADSGVCWFDGIRAW